MVSIFQRGLYCKKNSILIALEVSWCGKTNVNCSSNNHLKGGVSIHENEIAYQFARKLTT